MYRRVFGFAFVLFTAVSSVSAQVNGNGIPNHLPIWVEGNTLGNSSLFESNGMVGVGTITPTATLNVVGQNGGQFGSDAPVVLQIIGGAGTRDLGTRKAYAGGAIQLAAGLGARGNVGTLSGGTGGAVSVSAGGGGGGFVRGGVGGPLQIMSGAGGGTASFGPVHGATGGSGALIQLGPGAAGRWFSGASHGGDGGSITLQPGAGGTGTGTAGGTGSIALAPNGGNIGVGETNPGNTFEVASGGTTLADSWTTRSSRRLKINIQPLAGALTKVTQLQGVSYDRKTDGKHEIGVVAEDVAQIVPELVSRDPNTQEIQGVDYSRMSALLIEAIKSQQVEIQQLKALIEKLQSNISVQ